MVIPKGLSYEDFYGEEKAKEIRDKLKRSHRKYIFPSRKVLYDLYWVKGLTQKEIGEQLGFSRITVLRCMKRHGIPAKAPKDYLEGRTYEEIYGNEKARELKANRGAYIRGKKYEDVFGEDRAKQLKTNLSEFWRGKKNPEHSKRLRGRPSHRKGLSMVEEYGEEKAEEIIKKWLKSKDVSPNRVEQKINVLLQELFPNEWKYVGDGEFILGRRCPDFMNVNGEKKLIEVFGDYWHKDDDPQKRIDYFQQYGFDTLVVWEHELEDARSLKLKLLEFNGLGGEKNEFA